MMILIPIRQDGKIDYGTTEVMLSECYGWKEVSEAFDKRKKSKVATMENFLD